jgi:hypothetical protein
MRFITPIEKGKYYHIYNRGINGENFLEMKKTISFFSKNGLNMFPLLQILISNSSAHYPINLIRFTKLKYRH